MNCQAQITDHLGHKYKCENDAIVNVTVNNKKSKNLCFLHRHRYVAKLNYANKHLNRKYLINEEKLENENNNN